MCPATPTALSPDTAYWKPVRTCCTHRSRKKASPAKCANFSTQIARNSSGRCALLFPCLQEKTPAVNDRRPHAMQKLLVIDDEEAMRRLLRLNLSDTYEVIDTGDPEQGLALAMQNKPSAILLDLRMPRFSGFELCRTFTGLTSTQLTPVFIVSGEAGSTTKALCKELGATAYFEKPIDFDALRSRLAEVLLAKRPERRSEVRVRLRAPLKLRGTDTNGKSFEELTHTENVSLSAFLCGCAAPRRPGSIVEVFLLTGAGQLVGTARVVRSEATETPYPRYAFRFVEKTGEWVLQ